MQLHLSIASHVVRHHFDFQHIFANKIFVIFMSKRDNEIHKFEVEVRLHLRVNRYTHIFLLSELSRQCANTFSRRIDPDEGIARDFSSRSLPPPIGKRCQFITVISGVSFVENDVIVSVIDVASVSIFTCEQLQLFSAPRDIQIVSPFPLPSLYTAADSRYISRRQSLTYFHDLCEFVKIFSSVFVTD